MSTLSPVPDLVAGTGRGAASPDRGVMDAVLERVTYANEETGYTIARVATDRSVRMRGSRA